VGLWNIPSFVHAYMLVLSSGVMCFSHWTDRPTASIHNAVALGQ